MRGLNLNRTRVHRVATLAMESQAINQAPCWYKIIGLVPPSEIMTRTQPITHIESARKTKTRKLSKMFRPLPIEYEEDGLRRQFYSDHPWELARPRIVLEDDGKDGQRCDWSTGLQQPGRQLNGESVVQRQLYLMKRRMSKEAAYDVARKEFYSLRHEEEVERRVAKEEALWVGAHFGKGFLDIGMELEDKTYDKWKVWAEKEIQAIELQRDSAYTTSGATEDEAEIEPSAAEKAEPVTVA